MWSARPVSRIIIFYICGILSQRYFPWLSRIPESYLLASVAILLAISIFLIVTKIPHKFNWITGVVLGLTISLSAVYITWHNTAIYNECFNTNKDIPTIGNVVGNPVEGKNSIKATLLLNRIAKDSCNSNKAQKVMCYFEKDSNSSKLKYGDIILLSSTLSIQSSPKNPYEFDYQKYLKQNNILYTSFIKKNKWKVIDNKPKNRIIAYAGKIRESLLVTLSENGLKGDNYDVAAAILLGFDDGMEPELKQDFVMAGAMHILCVSGLHVGIIYLVINYLLSFLNTTKTNNIIKATILFLTVWMYAAITGLSPSVQRAALMISVFIIGNLLQRNRDTYNTLATSALILLLIDPQLLFNVGFQLSYAAVLGIITFHQPIYKLIFVKNTILDKVWSITVLSFAAQLATFPIAMHYFHFFPPWFWLTNLATFPLSFLIIVMGIFVISVSWIPYISVIAVKILSWFVFSLNYSVGIVKFLPFSGIENIYMSLPMIIVIYLLITLVYLLISEKLIRLATPICVLILLFITLITYHNYINYSEKKIVIYCINNHYAYEFINGKDQIIIADSVLVRDPSTSNFQLSNSRAAWGLKKNIMDFPYRDTVIEQLISIKRNFITMNNITIYLYNNEIKFYPLEEKLKVDAIVISGNTKKNTSKLLEIISCDWIIIDPTVRPWERKKIQKLCKESNIVYWNVKENGAWMINL